MHILDSVKCRWIFIPHISPIMLRNVKSNCYNYHLMHSHELIRADVEFAEPPEHVLKLSRRKTFQDQKCVNLV